MAWAKGARAKVASVKMLETMILVVSREEGDCATAVQLTPQLYGHFLKVFAAV